MGFAEILKLTVEYGPHALVALVVLAALWWGKFSYSGPGTRGKGRQGS